MQQQSKEQKLSALLSRCLCVCAKIKTKHGKNTYNSKRANERMRKRVIRFAFVLVFSDCNMLNVFTLALTVNARAAV